MTKEISVKKILNSLRKKYSDTKYLSSDPIELVYHYTNAKDRECVALFVALFSYGNVSSIRKFLNKILTMVGDSPFEFLLSTKDYSKWNGKIGSYRFQKEEDVLEFFYALSELIRESISETKLNPWPHPFNSDTIFEKYFINQSDSSNQSFQWKLREKLRFHSNGLDFLIGKGLPKSASKRYSMFLRWMVLNCFPDFNIYRNINENSLILPLDTHIQKIGKILNLTKRKSVDKKMAEEITDSLTKIMGEPGIRYDFALSRIGILEKCRGAFDQIICPQCNLRTLCCFYKNQSPK